MLGVELAWKMLKVLSSDCNIAAEAEATEHYLTRPTIRAVEHLVNFMHENPESEIEF
ncbi:MAG: hypothetical protein STSR0004_13970 [Peptococcaceae bacterium]